MNADETQMKLPVTEDLFEVIEALHRAEDSVIGISRKIGNGPLENLFSIARAELRTVLPEVAQWLSQDAYFTINGYKAKAPYNSKIVPGHPDVWRKKWNLRHLNAVYADIDVGRVGAEGAKGRTAHDVSMTLIDMVHDGIILPISISAQSGRGLYAFWLLRDEVDAYAPVTFKGKRSFKTAEGLYKRINEAIQERLQALAVDSAKDTARFLRLPGTLHSVNDEPCVYRVHRDFPSGELVTYTLNELAEFFGISIASSSGASLEWTRKPRAESTNPQKANGPKTLATDRAQDVEKLEKSRGGWAKGCRRRYIRYYAQFLQSAGVSFKDAQEALETMAARCRPPYPSDANDVQIPDILKGVWSNDFVTPRRENLVKWFQVSAEEARGLGLEKIVPNEVEEERKLPKGGARGVENKQRRILIKGLIETRGMLSEREFVAALSPYKFHPSRSTVRRDLIALGYQDSEQRKKAGRPTKRRDQMTLP